MFSPSVLSKIGQIAVGSTSFDEMEKRAGKEQIARSGLGRALKIVGLTTAAGGALAGAHQAGKSSGRTSGMSEGRSAQLKEDQESFREVVPKIFRAGRMVQARQDAESFKGYLSRNNPGMAGTSSSGSMKTAAEMATAVVDGWARGQIKTAAVKALPPEDIQKIAGELVRRIESGDEMAGILWRTLAS